MLTYYKLWQRISGYMLVFWMIPFQTSKKHRNRRDLEKRMKLLRDQNYDPGGFTLEVQPTTLSHFVAMRHNQSRAGARATKRLLGVH